MADVENTNNSISDLSSPSQTNIESETNEIKSPNNRKWLKLGGIALLLLGISGGGWWYWSQKKASQGSFANAQMPATAVKLATINNSAVEEATEHLGSLEANQTVSLRSQLEGRIVEILVREGQTVNRGKALFRLESDTLQAEYNQAQATVQSRQARLTELETGSRREDIAAAEARLRQAEVRLANVKKGSSQAEIAQAKAQLESAKAEARLAQQKVERYELLKEEGAISLDEFDNFMTEAKTATAQVDVAQKRLEELQQGTTSNVAEFQAAVDEAKQNLTLLRNGARSEEIDQAQADVQEAKANVNRVETLLDKTFVQAPISGTIGNIPVKVGDYIETEDVLTVITENSQLELNIAIPIEKAPQLRIGLPVQILNQKKEAIASGKVNFIESNVTPDSQLIRVQAIFNNNQIDRNLLNQQFIQARIIWNTKQGILIPSSSIFRIGGQAFVFTAAENPEAEGLIAKQKPISLGKIQGNSYQVLQGLDAGEKILTAGILQVQDGMPIKEMSETDTNKPNSNN